MRPTKVAHLIDANVDTAFFRLLARKSGVDFPVVIGSLAPEGRLQEAMRGLNTLTFGLGAKSRKDYPRALFRLTSLLRREHAGILHAHCFDPTFVGWLAARIARCRFVYTRHHSDHNIRLGKRWHTHIDAFCGRRADHVIAVSAATKQIMTDVEHVPPEKITVIHNGMEPLAEASAQTLAELRRGLGVSDRPICLLVGRLHEEKGHRVLFEAIPQILEQCGATLFLLVGDGPHRGVLEETVRRGRLDGCVRFLGQRPDVAALMQLSTLVVLPSLAESFGFVLVEAMCLGRPVVATTTGGIPEVVEQDRTGLLVAPGDVNGLASAIISILGTPERALAFGNAGRSSWRRFGAESMMCGYEEIYRRVIREEMRLS